MSIVPTEQSTVVHQSGDLLHAQMDYARAVQSANMLPAAYRGKPADIMLAVGLGSSMGLSPAESLYRINVIQGKPTASAELIASNVRKAGHRLRVVSNGLSVTASIWRSDDPGFEHTVTRDADWAKSMGLLNNDNYKKQGQTMLEWRAITAVARLACPEALYGVSYTPDEMIDTDRGPQPGIDPVAPVAVRMASMLGTDPGPTPINDAEAPVAPDEAITRPQLTKLHAVLTNLSMEKEAALAFYEQQTGRVVESSKDLTKDEASEIIDALESIESGR